MAEELVLKEPVYCSVLLSNGDYVLATLISESSWGIRVEYPFLILEDDSDQPSIDVLDRYGDNKILDIMKNQVVAVSRLRPQYVQLYLEFRNEFIQDTTEGGLEVRMATEEEIQEAQFGSYSLGNDTKH